MPVRLGGSGATPPQAEALLTGRQGVGHVIADAADETNPLRAFITEDLGATAQFKANPGRIKKPPINWCFCKERHQIGQFFNKLKWL